MAREGKIFYENNIFNANQLIQIREAFGWELTSISDTKVSMTRDRQHPHYDELVKLEMEYDRYLDLANNLYPSIFISFKVAFILFLIFIFPMIIYIVIKKKREKLFYSYLYRLEEILKEAKELI